MQKEGKIMAEKLVEHTYGTHIYMKMRLDNGRVESIDVYFRNDGIYYETSADIGFEFSTGEELERWKALRQKIIDTFHELY